MFDSPWWAGYVAGVVTVMGPSVLFLALLLYFVRSENE